MLWNIYFVSFVYGNDLQSLTLSALLQHIYSQGL